MADEERAPKVSGGDIAMIALQVFVAYGFSNPPSFHPSAGIQFFGIACVAYLCMVISLVCRNRKRGLTIIDRRIIVYGFSSIFIFAIFLTMQIWKWKYGEQIFG